MFTTNTGGSSQALTGMTVASIAALVGAVLIVMLLISPKRKSKLKGFWKKLSELLNFDRFLLSGILKFLYAFTALYCIAYGIYSMVTGALLTGILWAVLGPVALRVVFEQLLLLLSLREETMEGNDLLRRMQGLPPKNAQQTQQPSAQQNRPVQQPDPRYQQRPGGYNGGYGYNGQGRPAQGQPMDYGMTQRYAPIRSAGYEQSAYPPPPVPVTRPTPADGTGRFTAIPMQDAKKGNRK